MLPYSREAFAAFLGQYNAALWPLQIPVILLALGTLALLQRRAAHGGRIMAGLLALGWLWTGFCFLGLRFAALNFMAPLYGGFFVLQGLLLGGWGLWRNRLAPPPAPSPILSGALGWGLCGYALIGSPLIDGLWGEDWSALRLAGLTPGPTVMLTLGLLTLAGPRTPPGLLIVPLLWCGTAAYTAWALPLPPDYALPAAGVLTLMARICQQYRGTRPS